MFTFRTCFMTQPAGRYTYCRSKARNSWNIFRKISPYNLLGHAVYLFLVPGFHFLGLCVAIRILAEASDGHRAPPQLGVIIRRGSVGQYQRRRFEFDSHLNRSHCHHRGRGLPSTKIPISVTRCNNVIFEGLLIIFEMG